MPRSTHPRRPAAAAAAAAVMLSAGVVASPAYAQDPVYPGCDGFEVRLTYVREAGNPPTAGPRAVVMAGSQAITIGNVETGAAVRIHTAGSLTSATPLPDGSIDYTSNGSSLLIAFPGEPGGPSTLLYRGRLVVNQDAGGVLNVKSFKGQTVDVCAALGG